MGWELGYDGAWGCGIGSWDMMIRFGCLRCWCSRVKDLDSFSDGCLYSYTGLHSRNA